MSILEDIKKAVEERLAALSGESFAVFDFDNTCIVNDIGDVAFTYVCGNALLKDRALLGDPDTSEKYHERVFHMYHALVTAGKLRAAYMLCMRMFSGFSPGEAEAATLTAISEEGTRFGSKMLYGVHIERGLQVRKAIIALMSFLREREVALWVVSASPEPAVRAAMQHFGIEANLIGARSNVENDVFTQELIDPIPMFEGKVDCIRKYIDAHRQPLLAVGDSKNDEGMLEMAGIGVAIEGRELAALARERDWFIL